jgi:hypothetical protein
LTTVGTRTVFPSVEYFDALAASAATDELRYRRLGATDVVFALEVGDEGYRLVFEDYGCIDVSPWDGTGSVDFVLGARREDWFELVRHLAGRERADSDHTLNSLVLADRRFHLTGAEQLGMDKFYRFNATIQAYFEETRNLSVRFD